MNSLQQVLGLPPYSLGRTDKRQIFFQALRQLTVHHQAKCESYARILRAMQINPEQLSNIEELPFLPVSVFKDLELRSIAESEIFKVLTSSGTTGQTVSKIYLDREEALNQQKTLIRIVSDFTLATRLPMLIIDSPSVVKNRAMFSARGAGILGFSIFGTERIYALDDEMNLNLTAIEQFLTRHRGQRILIFGFTFMIWQHFYQELKRLSVALDLSQGIMIHGGGWKKLISEAVPPEEFKRCLNEVCGLRDIHEYYGMVEQTGCIYMQCEYGHLHASNFSDVIIRDHLSFAAKKHGEPGIIQVLSLLPGSYPGHSLLTEDEGVILGEDDCPCGRRGKYFKVLGRLKNAELRGCSDTYAASF